MVVTELGIGYSTLLKWVMEFHKKLTSVLINEAEEIQCCSSNGGNHKPLE
jgi:hypothetical protein